MTDFLKIAKSIVVHFAHICAYGVETVNVIKAKPETEFDHGHYLAKYRCFVILLINKTVSFCF